MEKILTGRLRYVTMMKTLPKLKRERMILIKSGGGKGPVKPGNLQNLQGANSFRINILRDEKEM